MAFHHVALATRDPEATHRFYTEAMGFELVKVEVGRTPQGGFAKHFFYDTGDGMIAFWDLHDEEIGDGFETAISTGLGLPPWTNHIAFRAEDAADIDRRRARLLAAGHDVMEVDHGWCRSIYAMDPTGTMVEWCITTRALTDADRAEAERLLRDPAPEPHPAPRSRVHRAKDHRVAT